MEIDSAFADYLLDTYKVRFHPRVKRALTVKGGDAAFEPYSQHRPAQFLPLGAFSYAQSFFEHVSTIGRYCSIGTGVDVMGRSHPTDWATSSPVFYRRPRAKLWDSNRTDFPPFKDFGPKVQIENDVWIGDSVLLSHGVTLGTGCIVAARSIVTHDVPPYAIVAGTPANIIRYRFPEEIINRLLTSKWWTWPVDAWDDIDPRDISAFLDHADVLRETRPTLPENRMTIKDIFEKFQQK